MNRVVALEIESEKRRNAVARVSIPGQIDEEVDSRSFRIIIEPDRDLASGCLAPQGCFRFRTDREARLDRPRRSRHLAIHVGLEKLQDLGSPPLPLLGCRHRLPIAANQGVRQCVKADLGLVLVGDKSLCPDNSARGKRADACTHE